MKQKSTGIRDRIIQTYKTEIESHKLNDRDFTGLMARIEDLKRKKEAQDNEKDRLKNDYESQLQSQQNVLGSLNGELDILRTQNQDQQKESNEIQDQTQEIRIDITEKDKDIREMNQEIQTNVAHNQAFERENENIKQSISDQQEQR